MLNNFLHTHIFFEVLISKKNECIFEIKFILLLFIKFDF